MLELERLPDWEQRFHEFMDRGYSRVYKPGVTDCAIYCADMVEAITGVDPAAGWRGTYSTEEEIAQILDATGGLVNLVSSIIGYPVAPLQARRADVVYTRWNDTEESVGVCLGARVAFPTASGIELRYSRRVATLAWRIG